MRKQKSMIYDNGKIELWIDISVVRRGENVTANDLSILLSRVMESIAKTTGNYYPDNQNFRPDQVTIA